MTNGEQTPRPSGNRKVRYFETRMPQFRLLLMVKFTLVPVDGDGPKGHRGAVLRPGRDSVVGVENPSQKRLEGYEGVRTLR